MRLRKTMIVNDQSKLIRTILLEEAQALKQIISKSAVPSFYALLKGSVEVSGRDGYFIQIAQLADNLKVELWYDFTSMQSQPLFWCGIRFDARSSIDVFAAQLSSSYGEVEYIFGAVEGPLREDQLNKSLVEIPDDGIFFLGRYFTSYSAEGALAYLQSLYSKVELPIGFLEGDPTATSGTRYERDPEARRYCIEINGADCCICGMNFSSIYGTIGEGYIHVHHLIPLSDPKHLGVTRSEELVCVCPNCHAMLHRHRLRTPGELIAAMAEARRVKSQPPI